MLCRDALLFLSDRIRARGVRQDEYIEVANRSLPGFVSSRGDSDIRSLQIKGGKRVDLNSSGRFEVHVDPRNGCMIVLSWVRRSATMEFRHWTRRADRKLYYSDIFAAGIIDYKSGDYRVDETRIGRTLSIVPAIRRDAPENIEPSPYATSFDAVHVARRAMQECMVQGSVLVGAAQLLVRAVGLKADIVGGGPSLHSQKFDDRLRVIHCEATNIALVHERLKRPAGEEALFALAAGKY